MGSVSTYRNLANCSLLLAISLLFASVSAIPSPIWRCKPLQFPATGFPVYRYAGRASLSQAREVCGRLVGTVPVVDYLPGECLQEYYDHINNTQGYAVVKNGLLTCFSPCQSNWCSGNCQADNNVTIVCQAFILVPERSIDFPECTQLPIPASGAVDYPNGRRFWAFARFRCAPGSVLNNHLGVFCEHDGQWRSFAEQGTTLNVERTCTQVCPNIQILLNGIIRKPLTPFTQPEVKCFDGWTLKGQPIVNCLSSVKRWEISGGSCLRTCPPTKHIVNGFLLIHDTSSGSMAIVACKDGFTFHGNSTVTCAGNGQWSPVNGSCKELVPEPPTHSCGTSQEYTSCASSCPETCSAERIGCTNHECSPGCHCKVGFVRHNGTCIDSSACPRNCSETCPVNRTCAHFHDYGREGRRCCPSCATPISVCAGTQCPAIHCCLRYETKAHPGECCLRCARMKNRACMRRSSSPCVYVVCPRGSVCGVRDGAATCVCKKCRPQQDKSKLVLGTDGQTYASACHRRREACLRRAYIGQ